MKIAKRNLFIGAAIAAVLVTLGIGQALLQNRADAQARTVQAPMFEVDPLWPKPLPNHWLLGCDHRRVGRRPGPHLDHPSRRGALHANEKGSS